MKIRLELDAERTYSRTDIETDQEVMVEDAKDLKVRGKGGELRISTTEHGIEVTYISRVGAPPKTVHQVFEFRDGEVIRVDRV